MKINFWYFLKLCPVLLLVTACSSPEVEEVEPEVEVELEEELNQLEEQSEEEWTFDVVPSDFADRLPEKIGGFDIPENIDGQPRFEPSSEEELPERFDWRDEGVVAPIKNQGECGSCWAFAAVSIAESVYAIQGGELNDLSEQWLINCNSEGWGCHGGLLALSYFVEQPDSCGGVGAVLETQAPYQESVYSCDCSATRVTPLPYWSVISTPNEIASTDTLKHAIKENGPIVATINADISFACYSKGIYNRKLFFSVPNHLIVLTGWDDSQGSEGVWFLRNSYGPMWGEAGTMRIEYGTAYVALFAAGFSEQPEKGQESADDSGSSAGEGGGASGEGGGASGESAGASGGGAGGGASGEGGGDGSGGGAGGGASGEGAGSAEGLLNDIAILDSQLEYLDDALEGQAEGVIPPTPKGPTVEEEDLSIDPNLINPTDHGLFGIWKQISSSKKSDVAPGGYVKSYLLISPSGFLEFVRYYDSNSTLDTTTRLDWRIEDDKIILGENKELQSGRMSKNLTLKIGSRTFTIVAPSISLPYTSSWSIEDNQQIKTMTLGTKTYQFIK
jgi:C1A family cysteine protease